MAKAKCAEALGRARKPASGFAPYPLDYSEAPASDHVTCSMGLSGADIIPFPQKRRPGRQEIYSDALAWELCDRIAEGGMKGSLRQVCQADDMPSRSTVLAWLRTNLEFRRRYELACWVRDHEIADEVVEIADKTTPETLARDRLQIDVRKWWLAKVAPRKYDADRFRENAAPGAGIKMQVEWVRYGDAVECLGR
jgi:hypothetical protein